MTLAFGDHATTTGVTKNHPDVRDTAITVFRPAANGAGIVPSRGAHDSFPLFFELFFFAIGFDQP